MTGSRGFTILILLSCVSCGCTHLHEDRAILAFTDALASGDIQELRDVTSKDFEQKALRRSEALDDLQVLRLPEEPPAIVEVKKVSDTEKEVTVTEHEGEARLLYKLVLDDQTKRWVVDDILTRQQKAGVNIAKPITEQMDLLLTIRDFLEAWDEDDRESVLAITSPEFRDVLTGLPTPWLARITQQVIGEKHPNKSQRQHKPQVAIDGNTAVVRLPRADGTLKISMELHDDEWKVDDAAVVTRQEESQIRSVKNRARILNAGTQFVEAFRKSDRVVLTSLSTKELNAALQEVKLSTASIPDITIAPKDYELRATVDHATILIPTPSSVVKLELTRSLKSDSEYRVKDLGLYDQSGQNKLLLSAFFTATKRVREFQQALARSDRKLLGRLSSREFDKRVWSLAAGLPIQLLPTGAASGPIVSMEAPESRGAMTHVRVQHERGPATFILLSADGRLTVDDVRVGTADRQRSLRKSLELATPILAFATGLDAQNVPDLQRVCSDDFNRKVWSRAATMPDIPETVVTQLTKSIRTMRKQPSRALVEVGSEKSGAVISLVSENQQWVIDDIQIINGLRAADRIALKSTMRMQVVADLKAPMRNQQRMASTNVAKPQPAVERQRFDLSRKDVPTRRRTLSNDLTSAEIPPPSEVVLPDNTPATKVASPVQQVAATMGTGSDQGVQHAVMFEPMENKANADAASMPGLVNPPADVQPMPGMPVFDSGIRTAALPKHQPMKTESSVDLDALFANVESTPAEPPVAITKDPVVAPPAATESVSASASAPITQAVSTQDTGRVTDPALHPIQIPRS